MAQGVRLSEEQVETIRQAWILTGNAAYAAKLAGCSGSTAAKFVRENRTELLRLRSEKAPSLMETLNAVLTEVLAGLVDPAKIKSAQYGELSRTAGIVIDKMQLLSGQATARVETGAIDPGKLTPEEMEQAARIRAKLAAEASR